MTALTRKPHPRWLQRTARVLVWPTLVPMKAMYGPTRWARYLARTMTRVLGNRFGEFAPGAGDVLVCSYYKSGTNWTLQIAVQIAYRGRAEYAHIHDVVPWPDIPARAGFTVALADESVRSPVTGLRVIKTHHAFDDVPYAPEARYICVVRDPKDVFVSSYHFTRANVGAQLMPTVEAWLDNFLSADAALGPWARHLASYWRMRDRSNVLFLTYEQMRADLPATVDALAEFLGVELTAVEKAAVIEQASFEHMKSIGHKFDAPGAPWASAAGAMMRRGERGRSAELLSPAQQQRIDDYCRAELERLGCDFPYDRAFGLNRAPAAASGDPSARAAAPQHA